MRKKNSEKPYFGKRILLFEGRARQCLPLIRSFRQHGCYVAALCSSKLDIAYASRFVNKKYLGICDNQKELETKEQLMKIISEDKFDLIVPTTDFAAAILSKNKSEIERYSKVAICDFDVFQIAENKNATMKVCQEKGIPCPKTFFELSSIEDVKNTGISFPFVIKPAISYGAIGFKVINNDDELKSAVLSINDLKTYVIQEYIPQTDIQYECAMFLDNNNDVKTSVVFSKNRWFPLEGGSSTLNITVDRKDIVTTCTNLLKAIGWNGAADIDLIQDPRDGVAKVMEINPRVSGSVKITFDAKTDQALQMLQLYFGDVVTLYPNYTIGRRLRCFQTDFLWFLKSKERFKTKPSWFSNYKTHDQIFYWSDPIPFFAFSFYGLKNYNREMKKRKK